MNEFIHEINHHINIPSLTLHKNSYSFLQALYERILYFHSRIPTELTNSIKYYNNSIPQGKQYDIIPKPIQKVIETKIKSFFFLRCHIAAREYNIYISYPYERKIKPTEEFKFIYRWLSFAGSMSKCPTKKITIYIYMLQLPKRLPLPLQKQTGAGTGAAQQPPLTELYINTAFTFPCGKSVLNENENEINLYRRDEWRKVFIHETFHCLGLDFSAIKNVDVGKDRIVSLFPLLKNTRINLSETYTEVMAELIMLLYIATEHTKTTEQFWRVYTKLINQQQIFSVFQTVKILHFMGLQYNDLCLCNNNKQNIFPRKQYHEETPIFSYYIIKSILFLHLNEFILWRIQYNSNKEPLYNVSFTTGCQTLQNGVEKFCDLIAVLFQSSKYKTAIYKMENFIRNYDIDPQFYRTLNMLYIQ